MNAIPYQSAHDHLSETMDQVCDSHAPVIITRQDAASVVLMSLEDYESIEETAYLLRSPANAAMLAESLEQARTGKVVPGKFLE